MAVYSYTFADGQRRWMYIIDLSAAADGRRRQMKRQGFTSQAAALAGEADSRAAYGGADLGADGTLSKELDGWLTEREIDVQPTTVVNYRDLVRCYITPYIGARQLYAVDKRVIHDLYTTLLKRGSKTGGPLSPTTVRTVHRVLMKALGDLGITVQGVRQPRQAERETMGRKGVWTPKQSAQFLRHHTGRRMYAAWALAIVTEMRRGEIAGLKWDKVDLDLGVLLVHWQRTATSTGVVEKSPKGKSKRALALGSVLIGVLRAHKARQDAEKLAAGVAIYHDRGYVFCREDGEPFYPKYFTDHWAKDCIDAGVPVISLHDARHTSATSGADAGVPEHVMQHRLGHADGRTTREVYTHVLPDSERKAAELMDAALLSAESRRSPRPSQHPRAATSARPRRLRRVA